MVSEGRHRLVAPEGEELSSLEVDLDRGFAIRSVRYLGRELMWRRDAMSGRRVSTSHEALGPTGLRSVEYFNTTSLVGGWFPMAPTVGLPVPGRAALRMHGSAPRLAWNLGRVGEDYVMAELQLPGREINLQRIVELKPRTVVVSTIATNRTSRRALFDYGEHISLAEEELTGCEIRGRSGCSNGLTWSKPVGCGPLGTDHHTVMPDQTVAVEVAGPGLRLLITADYGAPADFLLWERRSESRSGGVVAIEPARNWVEGLGVPIRPNSSRAFLDPRSDRRFVTTLLFGEDREL